MTIRSDRRDHWDWNEFWQRAVAVVGMCARQGKNGGMSKLGESFMVQNG